MPGGRQAFFAKNIGWQTPNGRQVIIFKNIACESPSELLATLANILDGKQSFFHMTNISLCLLLTWQDMAKGFMFNNSINI